MTSMHSPLPQLPAVGGRGGGSLLQFACKQSTYIIMPVLVTTSDPDIISLCRGIDLWLYWYSTVHLYMSAIFSQKFEKINCLCSGMVHRSCSIPSDNYTIMKNALYTANLSCESLSKFSMLKLALPQGRRPCSEREYWGWASPLDPAVSVGHSGHPCRHAACPMMLCA